MTGIGVDKEPAATGPAWVRAFERTSVLGASLAGVIVVAMALYVVGDVTSRVLFHRPFPGTIELVSLWAMPAIAFLSLGLAETWGQQIRASLALENANPADLRILEILVQAVTGIVVGWMILLSAREFVDAFVSGASGSAVLWVLEWPGRAATLIGLVMLLLAILARTYRLFISRGIVVDELGETHEVSA